MTILEAITLGSREYLTTNDHSGAIILGSREHLTTNDHSGSYHTWQ